LLALDIFLFLSSEAGGSFLPNVGLEFPFLILASVLQQLTQLNWMDYQTHPCV
jgi:hypothetical protein